MTSEARNARLDLLSISQTTVLERCAYGAPLVALIFHKHATIQQACCNHWDCPVCGKTRAKQEYHRITWGAEVLADEKHDLYFWTITCRGKELPYEDAMIHYLDWTNILLTNARTKAKREHVFWAYVGVTEHQQKTRKHPHSHLITTFCPADAIEFWDRKGKTHLASAWFFNANQTAQLGCQHEISKVKNASAVSRYIAKYLFKSALTEIWPANWHRVRYSRNWPDPPYAKAEVAIPLLKPEDWRRAADEDTTWICQDDRIFEIAYHRLANIRKQVSNVAF